MSKRVKKLVRSTQREPDRLRLDPDQRPGGPWATAAWVKTVVVSALFFLFCCLYAVWFYRVPFNADMVRYEPLAYCVAPEELVQRWCAAPFGEVAVGDRLPLIALAGAVWTTAFLLGRLVLSRSRVARHMDRLEYIAFATGLGLSGLSLLTLCVGLAGGLRQPLCFIAAGAVVALFALGQAWRARHVRGAVAARAADVERDAGGAPAGVWWRPRIWWLGIPFLLVLAGGAMLPSIHFDALEYHLQVPREWVQHGRIAFLPHNVYGNMPLGAEALVALTMALSPGELGWWWGALAGKLVLALFVPLAALLLVSAGRRYASSQAGTLAALLYVSTPWIVHVSVAGLNEGVLAFYVLAAVYAARLWVDCRATDAGAARGYVWLAGWMAGSAAACKYTSVVMVVIPLLVFLAVKSRRDAARVVGIYVLAAALACGLWYAKNWVQTGNPVYPLLAQVFPGQPRTPEQVAQFHSAHQVPLDAQGRRYSPAQAGAALEVLLGTSAWHSPLIVPLTLLVLLRRETWRQAWFWLAGLLVFVTLWWLVTHRVDRFVVPAWPLWALVAAIGATWSTSLVWRCTVWTVLACGLFANFVLVALPLVGLNHYFVKLEQLRDDPRLTTVSVAHEYLNAHVPPGKCALLVGDAGAFNVRVPVLYSTCFDTCILERLVRDRDASQRRAGLKELGVSHIYVDWAEIERYRQPGSYGFTDYITPALVHGELEFGQQLIRAVRVPDLDPRQGEIFEVVE